MDDSTDTDGPDDRTATPERRADRIAELERELDRREARIHELERRLAESRNLEHVADRIYRAILEQIAAGDGPPDPSRADRDTGGDDGTDEILLDRLDEHADRSSTADDPGTAAGDALGDEGDTVDVAPEAGSDATPSPGGGSGPAGDVDVTGAGFGGGGPGDVAPSDADGLAARLRTDIESLSVVEREMLRHYREHGPTRPPAAHQAVGGSGERTAAYAANRALRTRGLVEHADRGRHRYALRSLVAEAAVDPLSPGDAPSAADVDRLVRVVEASFVHDVLHPAAEPDPDAATPGYRDDVGAWPDA